ncbi:MAG TPA: hypothetical protein VHG09_09425 [Longimicrobiales bacterium]|nr:hypothetical protein [Longimicrobiales bacterium]
MLIHFATAADLPALTPDDLIAADALRSRGARVEPLIWSSPPAAERADAVVIRSCWDYHLREAAFRAWIAGLQSSNVVVINPPSLVQWNLHKSYIAELQAAGIGTVPTVFAGRGDTRTLSEIISSARWEEAVVKPAVSLSAYETWRVNSRDAAAHEERFMQLRSGGDVLVQEFQPQVMRSGEWSLMYFGRAFSHAVRKLPKNGDFRVQTEHGGSVETDVPDQRLIDDAARVLGALPERPVYCRVDGIVVDDAFLVMEVECIDPVLFFELDRPAADRFADEILNHAADGGRP